ncbi:unnamed protein product, partial [marine sediment metagenome]
MKIVFTMEEMWNLSPYTAQNIWEIWNAPMIDYLGNLEDITDATKDFGLRMRDLAIKDLQIVKRELKELFPGLFELYNILFGGDAFRKGVRMPKLKFDAGPMPFEELMNTVDDLVKELLSPNTTNEFVRHWGTAIEAVMFEFKSLHDGIKGMFKDVVSGWEQAIQRFMQLSGNFRDKFYQFIRDISNALYQSFVNAIALAASQSMLQAFTRQIAE